jgi:hypothetical protein
LPGLLTPTTCSGSESDSNTAFSMDEGSFSRSGSEMDLAADAKNTAGVVTFGGDSVDSPVPPPPGLEGCLCPWFWTSQECDKSQRCGSCTSRTRIAEKYDEQHRIYLQNEVSHEFVTSSTQEKGPTHALCLASLIQ